MRLKLLEPSCGGIEPLLAVGGREGAGGASGNVAGAGAAEDSGANVAAHAGGLNSSGGMLACGAVTGTVPRRKAAMLSPDDEGSSERGSGGSLGSEKDLLSAGRAGDEAEGGGDWWRGHSAG